MSESELTAQLARLRKENAHLAAYREISQGLLDSSSLEEVGSIVVEALRRSLPAACVVMALAAGPQSDARPWTYGGGTVCKHLPEPTLECLLDYALQLADPLAEPDAGALLTRLGLPPAPLLRNLLITQLRLGVLSLGAVVACNLTGPEPLSSHLERLSALLAPVPSAISHIWLLEARGRQARLLDSIVENIGTQIAYLDRNFRFLRVNQAYAKGSGHTVEELIGRNHFDLFPNAENEAIFTRVRDTGEPAHFIEKPFVYADQPERGVTYWDWTLTPLKNAGGEVEGLVFALSDRTDSVRHRQQARAAGQERLRQARVFQTVLENTSSFVVYLDPDLKIRLVNAAAERALAMPSEKLVGASLFDAIPGSRGLAPEGTVARGGIPLQGREFALSLPYAPERGVTYWDWTAVPVWSQEGEIEGVVVTANDVTEEVEARERIARAEQARAREARLLAIIQESTESNLVYFDRTLRLVQANSAFLRTANSTREGLVGKTVPEIFPGSEDLHELMRRARDTGEIIVLHELERSPMPWMTPSPQYWDFVITPVRDEQGEVEGLVVSGTDVTGQVMNREQLLEEERHRTRLAEALNAEINHRVKNNLAMIAGLLHMQIANRSRRDEAAQMVRQSISRLRAIAAVHEQLNETQLNEVEIVDAIRRIARASRQILGPDDLEVSVHGEPLHLPSRTATTLCVVVNELLTNAMKHGAPHHSGERAISVSVECEDGKLQLGVWNSGNAVAEDFDPRAQSQMGLRLVHGIIVDQLRGSFSILPADSGTRAQVTLRLSALEE